MNSEDEFDKNNQPVEENEEENDEVSENMIRAFSPSTNGLEEEVQQVSNEQGFSCRGLQQTRFKAKKMSPTKSAPIGRPHTRLFSSKNSQ